MKQHPVQLTPFQLKTPRTSLAPAPPEEKIRTAIGHRIPVTAVDSVVRQICDNPVSLKVVQHRISKSGDFRAARGKDPARITVNGNLNHYAFLITLIHELAHHHVNTDHSRGLNKFSFRRKATPLPHGREWKEKFRLLMEPYLNNEVFPDDILPGLFHYLENPKASSSADHRLSRVLKKYDPPGLTVRLEELPHDAVFTLHGRKTFRKKERIRTRYRCICLNTNRIYLVSAGAPVLKS